MSIKHSEANKRRWKKIPRDKRSKLMSTIAKIKQRGLSRTQRSKHSMIMVQAKIEKKCL